MSKPAFLTEKQYEEIRLKEYNIEDLKQYLAAGSKRIEDVMGIVEEPLLSMMTKVLSAVSDAQNEMRRIESLKSEMELSEGKIDLLNKSAEQWHKAVTAAYGEEVNLDRFLELVGKL